MLDKIKRAMGIKEKPVVKEKTKTKSKKTPKEIATAAFKSCTCWLSSKAQ